MSMRSLVSLAVVVALGLGFAAGWVAHRSSPVTSSSGSEGAPADGSISGHLLAVGGPGGIEPVTLTGSIFVRPGVLVRTSTVFTATVQSDGAYSISVPPGTYTVTGTSAQYNAGRTECQAKKVAMVSAGNTVVANVLCQVK